MEEQHRQSQEQRLSQELELQSQAVPEILEELLQGLVKEGVLLVGDTCRR